MMGQESWAVRFARAVKPAEKTGEAPATVLGTVVSVSPFKVSLFGGEIFAPPMPIRLSASAQERIDRTHHYDLNHAITWSAGDTALCAIVGKTVVVIDKIL